ncbi:hypothetical protein WP8W19C03_P11360 (plasmid) [Aeromonas veronii]|nr:hypothetical protein WP8W19C03_P11360 [Aeromonas veronii]
MDQAVNNLKMDYAERNPDGSPMTENGKPVLSPENEKFTDQMVSVLQNASSCIFRPIMNTDSGST